MSIKDKIKDLLSSKHEEIPSVCSVPFKNEVNYHDAIHLIVAQLPRITIAGHQVNGIDGIAIPEFHENETKAKYSGKIDEFRAAIEHFVQEPSVLNAGRVARWSVPMMTEEKLSPIEVAKAIGDHLKSREGLRTCLESFCI